MGKKIPKKIQKIKKKTSFRLYFYPERVELGRERGKKILVPYTILKQPRLENSKKKKEKIQKIKKQDSGIISILNGMR